MAITYEQIEMANNACTPIDIKGKLYMEVHQRIKAFRMVYPEGFIKTEMISNINGVCIFRAMVGYMMEKGMPNILGTGTAYEKEGSTFINKTSYLENAESSSVGRALGMAGFGIDTSVASAEEVQNAIANQTDERKATPKQIEWLKKVYTGDNLAKLLKSAGIDKLEEMPMKTASELIEKIQGGKKNE